MILLTEKYLKVEEQKAEQVFNEMKEKLSEEEIKKIKDEVDKSQNIEKDLEEISLQYKAKNRESLVNNYSNNSTIEMDKRMKSMQHELETLTNKYNKVKKFQYINCVLVK